MLTDEVRAHAAEVAAAARDVSIDRDALAALGPGDPPPLDPAIHHLDAGPAEVASYVLVLDSINFGSGWFPTLRKRPEASGYETVAAAIADRYRACGPWSADELRAMRADELADVLGQQRDHELLSLYAQALRQLGRFLGDREPLDIVAAAGGSAVRFAESLAAGMSMFADRGFYKRAQLAAADLALAGAARFGDLAALTIFADNVVPHVLRCEDVLVYSAALAGRVDRGELLEPGGVERELRGCAVHACELICARTGATAAELDNWLWNRGRAYKDRPRHRCRCVWY